MNNQPVQEADLITCWRMVLRLAVACRAVLVSQQQEKLSLCGGLVPRRKSTQFSTPMSACE